MTRMLLTIAILVSAVQLAAADVDFVDSPHLATRKLHNHNRLRSHSTWFDKPTPHPTTLDFLNSPYYFGNYGNSIEPQHHYFYEWPGRSHSTYAPTTSPTDSSTISTYMPTPSPQETNQRISTSRPTSASPTLSPTRTSSPSGTWNVLAHEHFLDGFGVFKELESQDAHHYSSTLGRQGVIQLLKSAALPSYDIAVDSSQLKVAFSFYANSMSIGEGFCLEYSLNDDTDWNPVRCWQSSIDFENSKWNDDFSVELNLPRVQVDSLRIKFVSIASRDDVDVMFDHISLLQLR